MIADLTPLQREIMRELIQAMGSEQPGRSVRELAAATSARTKWFGVIRVILAADALYGRKLIDYVQRNGRPVAPTTFFATRVAAIVARGI